MSEMKGVGALIKENLTLNTKTFVKERENVILDLGVLVNLLNEVGQDPAAVVTVLLKSVIAVKSAAAAVQYDRDKAHAVRDNIYASYYTKFSSTDPDVNPWQGKAKLTGGFIDSAVKNESAYQEAEAEYQELKYHTSLIYGIKDVLEEELDLVKNLAVNPGVIPTSGKMVDKEDIESQLKKFREKFS